MRRPEGRKRVHMLVAYGIRRDGTRHLLAFMRSKGESQTEWEGLLQDLYRRGLEGKELLLIVIDGCAGLAAAIQTVYPRARHQRCWVHKMGTLLEHVRKCDYDEVKAQIRYILSANRRGAESRIGLSQEAECAIDECQSNFSNCRDVRIKCRLRAQSELETLGNSRL